MFIYVKKNFEKKKIEKESEKKRKEHERKIQSLFKCLFKYVSYVQEKRMCCNYVIYLLFMALRINVKFVYWNLEISKNWLVVLFWWLSKYLPILVSMIISKFVLN